MIKFLVLPLVLTNYVPSQHHIADLEILRLSIIVEDGLCFLLKHLHSVEHLLSSLSKLDLLVCSPLRGISIPHFVTILILPLRCRPINQNAIYTGIEEGREVGYSTL